MGVRAEKHVSARGSRRVLIHLLSSVRWDEAERQALDVCRHFRGAGWRVAAVTRDAKVVDDPFRAASVPLFHSPLRGFFDPVSAVLMARLLRGTPRDLTCVHVHRYRDAFTVFLAKRLAGRPDVRIISTRHTVKRGRNSWLFRRIYDKVNAHIFGSRSAFDAFASSWQRLPMRLETVHVIRGAGAHIPLGEVVAEPERGPRFAIYAGPLTRGKGIETLIDAMSLLRDLKLRLRLYGNGDPDYLDLLRRRAMTRGVMEAIDWKRGAAPTVEMMEASHFAVFPSAERDSFGIGNLCAMAAGRAQIATGHGAQGEYLADGTTALFTVSADASSLADSMRRLATDPELRNRLGSEARRSYAAHLTWERYLKRLTRIYTEC